MRNDTIITIQAARLISKWLPKGRERDADHLRATRHALIQRVANLLDSDEVNADGGPGSGNWGHAGRPGKVGGSAPGGGIHNRTGEKGNYSSAAKERKKAKEQAKKKSATGANGTGGKSGNSSKSEKYPEVKGMFKGMSKEEAGKGLSNLISQALRSKDLVKKKEEEYTGKLDKWAEKLTSGMSVSKYNDVIYENGGNPENPFSRTSALRRYAEKKYPVAVEQHKEDIAKLKAAAKKDEEWERAVVAEFFQHYGG